MLLQSNPEETKKKKRKLPLIFKTSAIFASIYSTQFFKNYMVFRLPNDVFLYDNIPLNEHNETSGILNVNNMFKKIKQITIDENNELLSASIEDIQYSEAANLEFLRRKLESLGNLDAYVFAKTLKEHEDDLLKKLTIPDNQTDFDMNKLKNDKNYQMFCATNSELLRENSKMPCLFWKMQSNLNTKCLEKTEIGFNFKFIDCVCEHRSSFIGYLMKKGLPDCILTQENYFKFMNVVINQVCHQEKTKREAGHLKCFLTSSQLPKLPVTLQFKSNVFQTENYFECFVLDVFEVEKRNLDSLFRFKKERELARRKMKNLKRKKHILMPEGSKFYEPSSQFLHRFYPNVEITHTLEETLQRCRVQELEISNEDQEKATK